MPGRIPFGSYELLERIGEGGMAEVWRARSRGVAGFEKTVVIKRVLPSMMAREDFAKLLVREAKIAARLNHPNIVQIFELGEEAGAYFIAMEHVSGCDLATAIGHQPDPLGVGRGLDVDLRLWIAAEVAKALEFAHRYRAEDGRPLNIVHRDISPQNVLLGYEGQVKVADFGIALADERGLGAEDDPKTLRGKYAYMSPEQVRGETLDRRSDVFSLGIVLYEMLAGRRLFRGATSSETLGLVAEAKVPELDVASLGLPPRLGTLLLRSLAREREHRISSAGELGDELGRILLERGRPIGTKALAEALLRIEPPEDRLRINKLRFDLASRQQVDVARSSAKTQGPDEGTEVTQAMPTVRVRSQRDEGVFVVVPDTVPRALLEQGFAHSEAVLLAPADGFHEIILSAGRAEAEQGAQACRRLLDIGLEKLSGTVIASGELRRYSPTAAEATVRARVAATALSGAGVALSEALAQTLRWRFLLEGSGPRRTLVGEASCSSQALRQARRHPLVGRGAVLRHLAEAFEAAADGDGQARLLVGEAGVGKTRLLAELHHVVQDAHGERAGLVVAGPGDGTPYGAFRTLFADLIGAQPQEPATALAEKVERLRVLGVDSRERAVVRGLFGLEAPASPEGRPRGICLMVAARKAIAALGSDAPQLLCFEDVHRMDAASRHLLRLLVGGLRERRVLAVLSCQPNIALPRVDADPLRLEPLEGAAAARLFAGRVGARAMEESPRRELMRLTAGNPAWIAAVAAAGAEVVEGNVIALRPEQAASQGRVRTCANESAQQMMVAVASFPDGVDTTTLAAVLRRPRDTLDGPLQQLLTAGDVRGNEGPSFVLRQGQWGGGGGILIPSRICFGGGELARRAVLGGLSEDARVSLHGRIAEILEDAGAGDDARVFSLAHHVWQARDGERGPRHLAAAAQRIQLAEPARAAGYYEQAAKLSRLHGDVQGAAAWAIKAAEMALEAGDTAWGDALCAMVIEGGVEDRELRLRLGLIRARVLARAENWAAAVLALQQVSAALHRCPDPALRGRALVQLARAQLESGAIEAAAQNFEEAISVLEGAGHAAPAALAYSGLACALAYRGDVAGAKEVGIAALTAAAVHGGKTVRWAALYAAAELAEAEVLAMTGEGGKVDGRDLLHSVALHRWSDAVTLAREAGLDEDLARTCLRAALAAIEDDEQATAGVFLEEAATVAKQHGLEALCILADAIRALLATLAAGETYYLKNIVRAVDRLEERGHRSQAASALAMLARAHVYLGDPGAAIRTLARAQGLAREAGRHVLEARLRARAEELAIRG